MSIQPVDPRDNWRGYWAVMPTVFNQDYSLDDFGQKNLIDWYQDQSMHGLIAAGTVGEWPTLSTAERCHLFEVVKQNTKPSMPIVANCSAFTPSEAIYYGRCAAALDYDGIMLSPPPYMNLNHDEILNFFISTSESIDLPIVIYNWPLGTGIDLPHKLVLDLVKQCRVTALKNSTLHLNKFILDLKHLHNKIAVFGIMPGDVGLDLLLSIGGAGCMGAMGVLGRDQPRFFECIWKKDYDNALTYGRKDQILMQTLFNGFHGRFGNSIATFKYLLKLRGLPSGPVRRPLGSLSQDSCEQIRKFVKKEKLFDEV